MSDGQPAPWHAIVRFFPPKLPSYCHAFRIVISVVIADLGFVRKSRFYVAIVFHIVVLMGVKMRFGLLKNFSYAVVLLSNIYISNNDLTVKGGGWTVVQLEQRVLDFRRLRAR